MRTSLTGSMYITPALASVPGIIIIYPPLHLQGLCSHDPVQIVTAHDSAMRLHPRWLDTSPLVTSYILYTILPFR